MSKSSLTALQRQELAYQEQSAKCSRAFNTHITSLTVVIRGLDKNTGQQVAQVFDFSKIDDVPAEIYEFFNNYGAASVARRDIIRHRIKMIKDKLFFKGAIPKLH